MAQPPDDEAAARRARAQRLRRRTGEAPAPSQPESPPESPNDFVQRRMRELDSGGANEPED